MHLFRGVHLKIQMGMLVQFFRFEIWANHVFFLGEGGGGGGGRVVSNTGAFLRLRKASSSAPFQEERLGMGLYLGDVHATIQTGMLVQFLRV